MNFPVFFHLGPFELHPHFVFETLAYFIGFRLYLLLRNKNLLPFQQSIWVVVAAAIGAAAGSKLLFWLEDPQRILSHWSDWGVIMGGKTIVGGLIGGLIAVEWMKKMIGVERSTGDDFVFPLIVGMAIGRIGCFLTGLSDHTYGTPTNWFTGIDFGDGIPRHPTQLYEIVFLLLLAIFIIILKKITVQRQRFLPEGALFQTFMSGYLLFRLAIDFIKPTPHIYLGLNNIQVACILGLIYYAFIIGRWLIPYAAAERNVSDA